MSKRKFEVEVGYSVAYQSVWLEVEADDEDEAREVALDDFYDKVYIDSPLVNVVYMNELSDESEEPSSDD
jgi:hypothetical protein